MMTGIDTDAVASLHTMMADSSVITIVSHTRADGDAVGSTTALACWLRTLGKDAAVILPEEIESNLRFLDRGGAPVLSYSTGKEESDRRIATGDLIIALDFNSFGRAGAMEDVLSAATCKKVLIDHHIGPDMNSFDLVFSRCDISSSSELLFWILMEMPEISHDASRLPADALAALTAGMTTDTNNFANSVYPSTFKMASLLLEAGVDRDAVIETLYRRRRENRLRILGTLLKDSLKITPDGVAYMIIDQGMKSRFDLVEGETDGFVNMPLDIAEVRMSILVKADNDNWRVSVRSKKGISANRCSGLYFNGGGHEQAAGGKIPYSTAGDAESVATYIEKVTDEFFKDNI